jgi:BirA family biotin operon repressor/biotin-[acetyl-CoA-carboxylase] ligase
LPSFGPIGIPFIELLSVESTNNYAMGLAHAGLAQHGMAVFAHEQTSGKGQRNKQWNSEKDQNIALTLVIQPSELKTADLFLLSMAVAVAAFKFLSQLGGKDFSIKWPNDIYWGDRKAAGILLENIWQGTEWKFAIAGIGINVNQLDFGALSERAVSLKQVTGIGYQPLQLARQLCTEVDRQFNRLLNDPSQVINDYRTHLYKLNEPIRLKKDNRIFSCMLRDVSTDGKLIVHHGIEESFNVGDVEWIF